MADPQYLGPILVKDAGSTPDNAPAGHLWWYNESGVFKVKDSAGTVISLTAGGGGVTVQDEGSPLATTATTLNFVGDGVTASGTGATKTITIPTSFSDSTFFLTDEGDATKKAQFQLSGIDTSTTRTFTLPNVSSTIAVLDTVNTFTTYQKCEITSAATNTPQLCLWLSAQSTGTPAAGHGTYIRFDAETAAGNTEVGGYLSVQASDVTNASEDFDFVLSLMEGGAAAAERFKVTSGGEAQCKAINLSGNISKPYWGTTGLSLTTTAATYTDTSSSGTVANIATAHIAAPTLAASSSTTYTIASTLNIGGSPVAGSNVVITNGYALAIAGGDVALGPGTTRSSGTYSNTSTQPPNMYVDAAGIFYRSTYPEELVGAGINLTGVAVNNAAYQVLGTKSVTGISANDQIEIEVTGTYLNNSGNVARMRVQAELGSFTCELIDGLDIAASATNRMAVSVRAVFAVASTSSAACDVYLSRGAAGASNARAAIAVTTVGHSWHTSASNLTGTQTVRMMMRSSTTTATQTFFVNSWTIRRIPAL